MKKHAYIRYIAIFLIPIALSLFALPICHEWLAFDVEYNFEYPVLGPISWMIILPHFFGLDNFLYALWASNDKTFRQLGLIRMLAVSVTLSSISHLILWLPNFIAWKEMTAVFIVWAIGIGCLLAGTVIRYYRWFRAQREAKWEEEYQRDFFNK